MEKHFFIKATKEEINFFANYTVVSTPKLWGSEKWINDNIYKHEVEMRIPESAQIENGKTYSFKNYLKRTNDLQLLDFFEKFKELRSKYQESILW